MLLDRPHLGLAASLISLLVAGSDLALGTRARAADLRFNRDIRPILSDHCFQCHGPDASSRKAKLRLDVREGAIGQRSEGGPVVKVGDPNGSSLIARVISHDPDEVMPPPDVKKPLSESQVATLKEWIRQGAPYEGHWAYEPVERPVEPRTAVGDRWARNPIDRFIAAKWEGRGMEPSPKADPRTLRRRLNFDLTGLPPRPHEVDQFEADASDPAYERVVDELLRSPHFGERMAVFWLDLVRYGDTVGYHGDQDFTVWPYRDYVIRAFNANLPFSQFTRENLAGDLLPDATRDQKVASGYNRLLMITAEGGAQDREYRAKYAADRVRNTSTVWMGVTLGCAECHDHKYDPFTTKDFYSFSAYFADLNEKGFYDRGYPTGDWGPSLALPNDQQAAEMDRWKREIAALEKDYQAETPVLVTAQKTWEQGLESKEGPAWSEWRSLGPFTAATFDAAYDRDFGVEKKGSLDLGKKYGDEKLAWEARPQWKDGAIHALTGDQAATYLYRTVTTAAAQELAVSLGSDDALKIWLNGEPVLARKVQRAVEPDQEKPVLKLKEGENQLLLKVVNGGGGYGFTFKTLGAAPPEILDIVRVPADQRTAEQANKLSSHFRTVTPHLEATRRALADARKALADLTAKVPTTLVSERLAEPRVTRVLRRGNWLDDGGEVVQPAVPGFLPAAGGREGRRTRLDLAEWLVAPENPLTARVFVNRLWKQFFGVGLSKKLEDIGAQGEWPSHPELLDWLASEFRDSGWNVKHMVRLMVTSATYRQSSKSSERLREADPDNRLLARQAAVRLDAEFIRDNALAVSGLLVQRQGGPSVKPYQPAGYYSQLNFPKREYEADRGENQYRRGVYTHWQRTFLHPSLAAFDAPTREECTADRVRSNTPQQALALLNDPSYVEAARGLAERSLREGGSTDASRIRFLFREVLARLPQSEEERTLLAMRAAHGRDYEADPKAAEAVLSVGERAVPKDVSKAELASWTSVARVLLNLHEVITRS
ncbi:MAG: PSD1 domain-containing protein [Verrucomicrobiales bacterium]|nr:PSD1 domain-containing protein [Verrucomicrobiales bacterium]